MAETKSIAIPRFRQVFSFLGFLLVVRVTVGVMLNYFDYFPPNFEAEFLRGREHYFSGSYHWAFYAHILSGPFALILCTILISKTFRLRYRRWHRYLGRIAVPCILFVVAPSGLWMAAYVDTGFSAVVGFMMLSLFTGLFAAIGWRAAVRRRFDAHRRWMWRCYLALCSAVSLRLFAGTLAATGIEAVWIPAFTAWGSWLFPLLIFEITERANKKQTPAIEARSSGSIDPSDPNTKSKGG